LLRLVYEISAETMVSLAALGCSLSFHIDPRAQFEAGNGTG